MRRALLLSALLAAGCSAGAPAVPQVASHPDRLKYPDLRFEVPDPAALRTALACGSPAYLAEDPSLPLVDLRIYIRGGTFAEPPGKEGLGDLAASLMRTGGTASRDPDALDEELDFLAAQLNVSVDDVYGAASLSILAKDLDKGLALLADVLRNPAFRQEKLDTLKAQTLDALKARNDRTSSIEAREVNRLLYGEFPINRLATKGSIESITREDLAAFHAGWVHPKNFIVAAAGAFKSAELAAKLDAAFKDWASQPAAIPAVPSPASPTAPGLYCFHKDGKNINQGRVTMGHLGLSVHHPDTQAVRVMSYILGAGGFSSRLMQRVRGEEGLAYDVRSDLRPGLAYPLPFKIAFQSKSESCAYAAKLCLEEVEKIRRDGVTEQELKDAQQFYLDAFPGLFFSTRFQTASTYALAELLQLPKDYYATYRDRIARLTLEDVRRAAREHLKPERFVWVVVGDIPAILRGDPARPAKLSDFGTVTEVPLADPMTLERTK